MSVKQQKLVLISLSAFAVCALLFMLKRKSRQKNNKIAMMDYENTTAKNTLNGHYTDKNSLAAINHNPGNLTRLKGQKWEGETNTPPVLLATGRSTRFAPFVSDYYGLRAMLLNLKNGYFSKGRNTIKSIIEKYAPANENNTANYIKKLERAMQIDSTAKLDTTDKATIYKLMKEICKIESGFTGDSLIKYVVENHL